MPQLRISSRVQAFGDTIPGQLAEPLQRYVDWERFASGMPVKQVMSQRLVLPVGGSTIVNTPVVTGVLPGALYSVFAHPTKPNRYQVRYQSGAVSNPLVSLGTGLLTPGNTYQVVVNADGSIAVADTSVAPVNFGTSLARGDTVYLSGSSFGDAGPWSSLNQGFWQVVTFAPVGVSPNAKVTLKRVDPADPAGTAETVTASAVNDLQKSLAVKSALIDGPPAYSALRVVTECAQGWFSIDSLTLLPEVPEVSFSLITLVSDDFIGYARIEADGPVRVTHKSGDLAQGETVVRPVKFSDPLALPVGGWFEVYGLLTLISVVPMSDQQTSVNVILAFVTE
jgi:hypothetical protein